MPVLPASDDAVLDAVRSIRWPARRPAPAGRVGTHRSRTVGVSAEFTAYRGYRPGDEVRRIDWKLLARSDRAYIRLSNDRTILSTMLVVDASGSFAYPAATMEKWRYARQVALGLAAVAHRDGDPVGLAIATADGARRLPARSRRGVVREIGSVLAAVTPRGSPMMASLMPALRPIGRVAIISDFLGGDADALLRGAGQLAAAGREIHAVHVLHAMELDPPRGTTLVVDPEDAMLRRPVTEATRRRYLRSFADWRERLASDWRAAGAYYTAVTTAESIAHAVRRIAAPRDGAT